MGETLTERNCHKILGGHDMGGIRMTDCYETFIPLLRPARLAAAPSTATMATTATAEAAATDFLTATGFRSRQPSERATERRRLSRFTEAISVSIPFVCRHRQADSRNFESQATCNATGSFVCSARSKLEIGGSAARPPPAASRRSFSPFWHALPPSHPALINASHYYRVGVRVSSFHPTK